MTQQNGEEPKAGDRVGGVTLGADWSENSGRVHSGTKQTASGTRDEAKLIADGAKLEKALLDECERIKKEEPVSPFVVFTTLWKEADAPLSRDQVRANKKLGKQSQKECQ